MVLLGIFGRKKESDDERLQRAREQLSEAGELCARNASSAGRKLAGVGREFCDLCRIEGPLHAEFRKVASDLWSRTTGSAAGGALPAVDVAPWSTWDEPKVGDLTARASQMSQEVLYCTGAERRRHRDALVELEALRSLAEDESVAMATVGEEDMFFRRSFLLSAAEQLDPESEDIAMDFDDLIKKLGLKMSVFVG